MTRGRKYRFILTRRCIATIEKRKLERYWKLPGGLKLTMEEWENILFSIDKSGKTLEHNSWK